MSKGLVSAASQIEGKRGKGKIQPECPRPHGTKAGCGSKERKDLRVLDLECPTGLLQLYMSHTHSFLISATVWQLDMSFLRQSVATICRAPSSLHARGLWLAARARASPYHGLRTPAAHPGLLRLDARYVSARRWAPSIENHRRCHPIHHYHSPCSFCRYHCHPANIRHSSTTSHLTPTHASAQRLMAVWLSAKHAGELSRRKNGESSRRQPERGWVAQAHTSTHKQAHTKNKHTSTYKHIQARTSTHTHTHAHTRTHKHTQTYTNIHKHTHTSTGTLSRVRNVCASAGCVVVVVGRLISRKPPFPGFERSQKGP